MATKTGYMNGVDAYLYSSAWASLVYTAAAADETIVGTSGANFLYDSAGGDVLIGGTGDNTYYVSSANTTIEQAFDGTTDTVVTALSYYVLPTSISNLTATANNQNIVGNAANNLIILDGGGAHVTLGSGNGAIVEESWSEGSNIFLFTPSSGEDSIYGFNLGAMTHDFIELTGYEIDSYAQIQGDMSQQGSNVIIQLSPTNSITLRNVQLSTLNSDDFLLPIDASSMTATFTENFNSLALWNPTIGGDAGWKTNFFFADQADSGPEAYTSRYLGNAGYPDLSLYTDPYFCGTSSSSLGLDPFSVQNGVLAITATKVSASTTAYMSGHTWSSGMITTQESFSQTYGYFEIRAKLPSGAGMDSAFWLWSDENNSEIDVFEQPNGSSEILQTVHGTSGATSFQSTLPIDTTQFNTYGALWTPTTITFYVDGVATGSIATPSNMHDPMYMIANLGVGSGGWEGAPTANETTGEMQIDYIEAFSLADSAAAIAAAAASNSSTASATLTPTLTAAQAADYAAGTNSFDATGAAFTVEDTAANVAANFDALNGESLISSIALMDPGDPVLTLTASQAVNDTTALAEITNSSYQVSVADSEANLSALTLTNIRTLIEDGASNVTACFGGGSYSLQDFSPFGPNDAATIQAFLQGFRATGSYTEVSGSAFELTGAETLVIGGAATLAGSVTGDGALALTGGTTTLLRGAALTMSTLSVAGAATTLLIDECLTYTGAFTEGAGAMVKITSGDTLALAGESGLSGTLSGPGTLFVDGGQATFAGVALNVANWSVGGQAAVVTFDQRVLYSGAFSEASSATITTTEGFVLKGSSNLSGIVTGSDSFSTSGPTKVSGLVIGGEIVWDNKATVTQSGASVTLGDAAASIHNAEGSFYDIADNGGILCDGSAPSSFKNQGTLEKTGGAGTSMIAAAVANSGAISVASGTLDLKSAVSGTGVAEIGSNAALEFDNAVAKGQTIDFMASSGSLLLDDLDVSGSQLFHGSISNFQAGDGFDAAGFGSGTTLSFTENRAGTGGALTLTNGTAQAALTFLGQYNTSNFVGVSDGLDGTMFGFHS